MNAVFAVLRGIFAIPGAWPAPNIVLINWIMANYDQIDRHLMPLNEAGAREQVRII